MAKNKRIQSEVEREDDEQEVENKKPARRPSRLRWFVSRLVVMLLLIVGLIALAPMAISKSGLWRPILAAAAPEYARIVEIQSLSLGWIGGIDAKGITIRDDQGQPFARVDQISSQKTLLELAANYRNLGHFSVIQPELKIVLRPDGSNIEDFLAKLPKTEGDSSGTGDVQFKLRMVVGKVELDDQIAGRQWALSDLDVAVDWPAGAVPKTGKVTAVLAPLAGSPPASSAKGKIAADFSWQAPVDLASGGREPPGNVAGVQPHREANASRSPGTFALGAGQAQVNLTGLATEAFEGTLRRFAADVRPAGAVTLDAQISWTENGQSSHLHVRHLAAPQLSIAAPAYLGPDRLALNIPIGQLDLLVAGNRLDLKQLRLESNLVQLAGQGSAAIAQGSSPTAISQPGQASDALALLSSHAVSGVVTGQVNLPELARQLPNTLRLKEGTRLESGTIQVTLSSQSKDGQPSWEGSLKTDEIRASAGGRPIEFNQPLSLEFAVRQTPQGPVIDRLVGQASFLQLTGGGTLAQGSITANADLDQLVAELGRVIDWGDTRLAGTLAAEMKWSRGAGELWTAAADARVQNFELAAAKLAPWRESDLRLTANATGLLGSAGLTEISAAKLTVASAQDKLEATLVEPVHEVSSASAWPLAFTLRGDLETWMPRLQPFVPLSGWRMAGTIDVQGAGRFAADQSQLGPTKVQFENLDAAGPGLWIQDQIVKIDTAGTWDQKSMTLVLPSTTLASTAIAARADDVRVVAGTEPSITGLIDFRGDPTKLSGWIGSQEVPRTRLFAGELTGHIEIGYRGQNPQLEANWSIDCQKFDVLSLAAPPEPTGTVLASSASTSEWKPLLASRLPPQTISVTGQASYNTTSRELTLAKSGVQASFVSATAAGKITELGTRSETDLQGEISYDLATITALVQALYPVKSMETLKLAGQEKRPFALKGPLQSLTVITPASASPLPTAATHVPLLPQELLGEASLGWQGAEYVGLVAGPADFRAKLDQGIVNIGPLDIPVSEGRLTTAPRLLLNDRDPALVVDRGPLVQNVRITPEMCNLWLKYVAPLVADATRAEGKFSLNLEATNVPIADPLRSTIGGTLHIQSAQVGPGPLAQQYLGVIQQVRGMLNPDKAGESDPNRGWLIMPEQQVQFAVEDGWVHHQGMTMAVGNVSLITSGKVRIADQAIQLTGSIPVQDSWFKKEGGLLSSLKGQTIPITVSGTLSQPKLQADALKSLGGNLAGSALKGLMDKGSQRIDKVIGKDGTKLLEGFFGPRTPATTPPAPPVKP